MGNSEEIIEYILEAYKILIIGTTKEVSEDTFIKAFKIPENHPLLDMAKNYSYLIADMIQEGEGLNFKNDERDFLEQIPQEYITIIEKLLAKGMNVYIRITDEDLTFLCLNFEYSTDGERYTVVWSSGEQAGSVSTYKEYGRRGRLVRLEPHRDGKIVRVWAEAD